MRIGKDFGLMGQVIIDYSHGHHIEIGDNVILAPRVHILAHDTSTKLYLGYTRIGKVKIGNRVFVGAGTIILPGVSIGDDVIIGAGSVVSRDIPARTVAGGNPARVICSLDEFLDKRRKEFAASPCFGEEYTRPEYLTMPIMASMNQAMKDRIGFIV
ncbi:MAG TPA: DapH/DapD/GlmU-related protein [Terracidiphilus sp.]